MKQPIASFFAVFASLVVGNAAVGCGSDDSPPGGAGASGGSAGASGGSAGRGGSAGNAGTSGSGGNAGSSGSADSGGSAGRDGAADGGTLDIAADTAGTIPCGTMMCSPFDLMGTILPACCAPGEMNACGLMIPQGLCLTRTPGTSNPLCPDLTVQTTMGPMSVPGCCTVTGVCGGNLGAPVGCNELSPFTGQAGGPCGPDAGPPPTMDGGLDSSSDSAADAASDSGGDTGTPPEAGGDASDGSPGSDARDGAASDARLDARSDG